MSYGVSFPSLILPPKAFQEIIEYLDPVSQKSVAHINHSFSQMLEPLRQSQSIDWSRFYVARTLPIKVWSILSEEKVLGHIDLFQQVMSFVNPEELASFETISRRWERLIGPCWKTQSLIQRFFPEKASTLPSWKRTFQKLYKGSFGAQFYRQYLGEVGEVPPIPQRFIQIADQLDHIQQMSHPYEPTRKQIVKNHYQLILIPEFLTIYVPSGSFLTLHDNGTLGEEVSSCREEPAFLKVPLTLYNLGILVNAKKMHRVCFHADSWGEIFLQHGDTPVRKSFWVYQRVSPLFGLFANNIQTMFVGACNRIITPLINRVFLNVVNYIKFGKKIDTVWNIRTSTLTSDLASREVHWSTVRWRASNQDSLLLSHEGRGITTDLPVPVAVEISGDEASAIDGVSYAKGIEYYSRGP